MLALAPPPGREAVYRVTKTTTTSSEEEGGKRSRLTTEQKFELRVRTEEGGEAGSRVRLALGESTLEPVSENPDDAAVRALRAAARAWSGLELTVEFASDGSATRILPESPTARLVAAFLLGPGEPTWFGIAFPERPTRPGDGWERIFDFDVVREMMGLPIFETGQNRLPMRYRLQRYDRRGDRTVAVIEMTLQGAVSMPMVLTGKGVSLDQQIEVRGIAEIDVETGLPDKVDLHTEAVSRLDRVVSRENERRLIERL